MSATLFSLLLLFVQEQPDWLEFSRDTLTGTVKGLPTRETITLPIEEQMIVEFYSR